MVATTTVANTLSSKARTRPGGAAILIVDDSSLIRDMAGAALKSKGYEVIEADNGLAALVVTESRKVDLVILDDEMPEMSGLEFLSNLRATPTTVKTPVIMLISSAAPEVIVEAAKFGVRSCIRKSRFEMGELLARIQEAIKPPAPASPTAAAAPAPHAEMAPAHHIDPVPAAPALKPSCLLPGPRRTVSAPNFVPRNAALKTVEDFGGNNLSAGMSSLGQILSGDQSVQSLAAALDSNASLAGRVLQAATATAIAPPNFRPSLEAAIDILGVPRACNIATASVVYDAFTPATVNVVTYQRWRHYFSVGALLSRLVPRESKMPHGLGNLIGLCQNAPLAILRERYTEEFAAAVDFARQAEMPVGAIIPSVFGAGISDLARKLPLPTSAGPVIIETIKAYCTDLAGLAETHLDPLAQALCIATQLANALTPGTSIDEPLGPVDAACCAGVGIPNARRELGAAIAEASAIATLLMAPPPQEYAAMIEPLIPRSDMIFFYKRDAAFADLDPIESALSCLCDLRPLPASITPDDAARVSGVIIVAPSAKASLVDNTIKHATRGLGLKDVPILAITAHGQTELPPYVKLDVMEFPTSLRRLHDYISPEDR